MTEKKYETKTKLEVNHVFICDETNLLKYTTYEGDEHIVDNFNVDSLLFTMRNAIYELDIVISWMRHVMEVSPRWLHPGPCHTTFVELSDIKVDTTDELFPVVYYNGNELKQLSPHVNMQREFCCLSRSIKLTRSRIWGCNFLLEEYQSRNRYWESP